VRRILFLLPILVLACSCFGESKHDSEESRVPGVATDDLSLVSLGPIYPVDLLIAEDQGEVDDHSEEDVDQRGRELLYRGQVFGMDLAGLTVEAAIDTLEGAPPLRAMRLAPELLCDSRLRSEVEAKAEGALSLTLTGVVESSVPLRCVAALRTDALFLEISVADSGVFSPLRGHPNIRHLEVRGSNLGNPVAEFASSLPQKDCNTSGGSRG
jgi:hypothetical protein